MVVYEWCTVVEFFVTTPVLLRAFPTATGPGAGPGSSIGGCF
jgi:hypothetical protein